MKIRIVTLLTGAARPLGGTRHLSGIDKHPRTEPVWLGSQGFMDDEQGDRKNHGGPDKAVHHYAFGHYPFWIERIGPHEVLQQPGAFGENLSSHGLTESDVCIGDVYRLGDAIVEVSQARQPCWKLNLRFQNHEMARLVQQSARTGWYYRILQEGNVAAGDDLILERRPQPAWSLARLLDALYRRTLDAALLQELAALDELTEGWRSLFRRRLESGGVEDWSKRLDSRT